MSKASRFLQIIEFLKKHKIRKFKINDDYTVDVFEGIHIEDSELEEIPFQFGMVNGSFTIWKTKITSLKGCPWYVQGSFWCYFNDHLTSLEGAPIKVEGLFNCSCCDNLASLKGSPKFVSGGFFCDHCPNLITLEGAPEYVGGMFSCEQCDKLKSIDGLHYVGCDVKCDLTIKSI